MEEDVGVKAPVTRLRSRLSMEQSEDVNSPATPTKKRGGRLAVKPQLELINENTQVSSPRKTRRRSAADTEEKPVTPSRRSTRIKSNTSIVLETLTAQTTDSPRARRAMRRNSQAGSDNEGPVTPARTRRPRKDSASSGENQEPAPNVKPLKVAEMIIKEEPENEVQKPVDKSKSSPRISTEVSPNDARKSKRLSDKRDRRTGSSKSDLDTPMTSEGNTSINTKKEKNESKANDESNNQLNKSTENTGQTDELSESNRNLLKTLDADSKVKLSNHNKSAADLDAENPDKKKRNRTESWPSATRSSPKEPLIFSDNEQIKKKKKQSLSITSKSDLKNTTTKDNIDVSQNENENSQIVSDSNSEKRKSFTIDTEKRSANIQQIPNDNCSNTENNNIRCDMAMLFESSPNNVQTEVYFEDSDSNGVNTETVVKFKQLDGEDQCVPEVKHDIKFEDKLSSNSHSPLSNSKEVAVSNQVTVEKESIHISQSKKSISIQINDSCEPMDIDESIHEDVLHKSQNSLNDSNTEFKSLSQNTSNVEQPNNNKSKRKSSISTSDTPNRSKNENKSTLILSQIQEMPVTSTGNTLKSPKANEALSKSINSVDNSSDIMPKSNLSRSDVTGTPLKHNNMQKLTLQTSTPITSQPTDNKMNTEDKHLNSEKINSDLSKSIEEDCEEPSKPKSMYLDDEAEEASDDYESGDSRDDEERQYEDENEIVERGETLGSDNDVSNDTDYEKDSFVVSSDAEDNELLSGSGEDLCTSDNELTMSKNSKKKYNERKLKDQKNASREMFESRHKLNSSEAKSPAPKTKSNRRRIDSSLLESDDEVVVKTKKNNRLRLDSTLDTSMKPVDANKSHNKSNEKAEKSIYNQSTINELEITVRKDTTDAKDPLFVEVKKDPKTPMKDFNISVLPFTITQEIEDVEVSESILNQTETDPLQATLAHAESDSSESEELLQNYDSVLNDLNKNNKSKLNNNNFSLNLGEKIEKVKHVPIIEQLNLTNPKKSKKNKKEESQDVVDAKTKTSQEKLVIDNEGSSNSIERHLLFSDDNCGSGDENEKTGNEHQKYDDEEMFVPLSKSSGKTNIPESIDTSQQHTTLNDSSKKKKKRKTSIMLNDSIEEFEDSNKPVLNESIKKKNRKASLVIAEMVEEHLGDIFFIDTTGAVPSDKADNVTQEVSMVVPGSGKKKKNKKLEISQSIMPMNDDDDSDGAPVEILYRSEKSCNQVTELQNTECNFDSVATESNKKKKKKKISALNTSVENTDIVDVSLNNSKKRKRKTSDAGVPEDVQGIAESVTLNESLSSSSHKKKRKISYNDGANEQQQAECENELDDEKRSRKKKKNRELPINFQNITAEPETTTTEVKKSKKRKERDDDNESKKTKVSKENSFQEIHLPTLPASILDQLDDKPKKVPEKNKVISTSNFIVENSRQKRAKPSNYLEESVYLDADSPIAKKEKPRMKKPKVLPFIPTASISDSGFTTNFKINKVSQNIQFVAEPAGIAFSKEQYLQKDKLKRLGTYDRYKKHIHKRLSKF